MVELRLQQGLQILVTQVVQPSPLGAVYPEEHSFETSCLDFCTMWNTSVKERASHIPIEKNYP